MGRERRIVQYSGIITHSLIQSVSRVDVRCQARITCGCFRRCGVEVWLSISQRLSQSRRTVVASPPAVAIGEICEIVDAEIVALKEVGRMLLCVSLTTPTSSTEEREDSVPPCSPPLPACAYCTYRY